MNHISIEGMDGVGKSTTCKLLAERLGYIFVEKPLHYLLDDSDDEIKQYQKVSKSEKAYERMIYFCETKKLEYIIIDTSNKTPEETVDLIMKRNEELK